jgi:hypothetical protein
LKRQNFVIRKFPWHWRFLLRVNFGVETMMNQSVMVFLLFTSRPKAVMEIVPSQILPSSIFIWKSAEPGAPLATAFPATTTYATAYEEHTNQDGYHPCYAHRRIFVVVA